MRLRSLSWLYWLAEQAAVPEASEYAVDALPRDADSFCQEHTVQFLAPTARVLLAQLQDPLDDVGRRLRLADIAGPPAANLQTAQTMAFVAVNPAPDRVRAVTEMTCCQTQSAVVLQIPLHNNQSALGFCAWLCREPGQTRRSRQQSRAGPHLNASVSSLHFACWCPISI